MNRYLFILLALIASCESQETHSHPNKEEYELFGVTDFKTASSPVCIWLNGEPVFNLVRTSTFPRISNSYPIRKGENQIKITSLTSDLVENVTIPQESFFYSNGAEETFIKLAKSSDNLSFEGSFQGAKNYDLNGAIRRIDTDEETQKHAKNWTVKYLELLRDKKKESLPNLFAKDIKNADWAKNLTDFFLESAVCLNVVKVDEMYACKGKSIILICSNDNLAEWQIGATNRRIDNFLFCATTDGLYIRVAGGEWIKTKLPEEK